MRFHALLLSLILAGCSGTPLAPSPTPHEDLSGCLLPPQMQEAVLTTRGYSLVVPGGSMASSRVEEFRWSRSPHLLQRLEVTLVWESDDPLHSATLRAGVRNSQGTSIDTAYHHGPFEGPSPLSFTWTDPPQTSLEDVLAIEVEAPWNATPVGSILLVDHDVTIHVIETYRCGAPQT